VRASALNKMELIKRLDPIKYEKEEERDEEQFRQMSLAGALLALAGIDHEREYALCRAVAEHLLGKVAEPDEVDTGEETE